MVALVKVADQPDQLGQVFRAAQLLLLGHPLPAKMGVHNGEGVVHGGDALAHQLLFLLPHGQLEVDHALGPGLNDRFNVVRVNVDQPWQQESALAVQNAAVGALGPSQGFSETS